tara:strand:- start:11518 stop:11667 length:150 start_codon:yes stop_codon:yes gene_type:complete
MYLLGIHDGHNASVALMKDGKIIDAFYVLDKSGLKYLAIENYLVEKSEE